MAKLHGKKNSRHILQSSTSGRKHLQDPGIVEKKNRRDLAEVGGVKPLMEQEVYQSIDWMREGKSIEWITNELRNTINERTNRKYAPRFVENIVTTANQLLLLWYRDQIYRVEKLHVARYNHIMLELLNKDYEEMSRNMPPWVLSGIMGGDLETVLLAMKQKETLLGIHRKTFRVVINNQLNFDIREQRKKQEKKKIQDISLLSLEEQIELLELIQLSSQTDDEVHGVILKEKKAEVVEDIEVEVIENRNIEKIEKYTVPKKDNSGSILEEIQRKLLNKSKK